MGIIEFGVSSLKTAGVELFVKDTGIGIPPEKHDIIFERFRQADDTVAISYGGSGLGLSIVKQLVELMGGKISLESEAESGAIFRILLPYNAG
jgi:signal transduction histidine kinase